MSVFHQLVFVLLRCSKWEVSRYGRWVVAKVGMNDDRHEHFTNQAKDLWNTLWEIFQLHGDIWQPTETFSCQNLPSNDMFSGEHLHVWCNQISSFLGQLGFFVVKSDEICHIWVLKSLSWQLLECPLGMLSILAHQLQVALAGLTEQDGPSPDFRKGCDFLTLHFIGKIG